MRRTPPGGPNVAVAFAEPDEPERKSWLRRLATRVAAFFSPRRRDHRDPGAIRS